MNVPHLMARIPEMHMIILGGTGGGKSWLAQHWGRQENRNSIYIDFYGKVSESHYQWYGETMEEIMFSIQNARQIALITDNRDEVIRTLQMIYETFKPLNMKEPLYLILDECQFYSDHEIVDLLVHTGRKYNIFVVMVSRTMADVVYRRAGTVSQMTDVMVVGGLSESAQTKMKSNYDIQIPDSVLEHLNAWHWDENRRVSDHNSVYYDSHNWDLYNKSFTAVGRPKKEDDEE